MHWSDDALVIGGRPHGEGAVLLDLLTREHGRHGGILHGGRSRHLRPVIQAGNGVRATWRARLDEQLGTWTVEGTALRAGSLMGSPAGLYGLAALVGHLRLLPERDPHPRLHDGACELVEALGTPRLGPELFVRFELLLLAELGYGLDLGSCAVSGSSEGLSWVSPRSGRAVSAGAGEPWRDRLLALPRFLAEESAPARAEDLAAGFRLAGFFLEARLYGPLGRGLPEERARYVAHAVQEGATGSLLYDPAFRDPSDSSSTR